MRNLDERKVAQSTILPRKPVPHSIDLEGKCRTYLPRRRVPLDRKAFTLTGLGNSRKTIFLQQGQVADDNHT
ncbi:hypothetical protein Pla22_34570 [Rubripirellula amarantea]|uniref:Uncharacterized protein n=1 Tax=Rubripirellula amarantea TaxID=2527999 RepID=A0A5C5WIR6_9BACT|nr:hypothetical protein Pla22_34570 [Rubripirellula amarantea]